MLKSNNLLIAFVLTALATFTTVGFASDNTQQITSILQKVQSLQAQLDAANNKIAQLDNTITKNTTGQIDVSKIHQTANGRH